MKKKIILGVGLVLLLTGCGNSKIMVCNSSTTSDEVKRTSSYNVTYKNGYVTKLETTESITTASSSKLLLYKSALEKQYEDYNNIKYYDNSITIKGNELISKTIIDYSKVDTKKMIEVNKENENLIVNGKVKVSALESLYKKNNISCKK